MCLKHRTLVPTANFRTLSPKLPLQGSPFFVNRETRPWTQLARGQHPSGVNHAAVNQCAGSVGPSDAGQANASSATAARVVGGTHLYDAIARSRG